ncbi:DUF2877 domain-containing protein [Nostocoides sp. HKS02]|uniref:oxamate carbamoyltransferase subunit AllH family protein n=1 Tax=Nostocoides sp. HKS02 TaxID=1813880 RepID=UPI0012B4C033|nr:DUF2877 domain-containing protein [Tetrasphaera sp. HKS02]QGN56576.1 DUF2877 domain-containing protein [Tetrasphaera sp. HKS02]
MTLWPAAVSERSAVRLAQPPRPAVVLGAFPRALYLGLGGHADVLPLVAPSGLRLPTALTVATEAVGWGVQPGDEVLVGGGAVHLPGVCVRAVRTWRPARVPTAVGGRLAWSSAAVAPLAWSEPARLLTQRLRSGRSVASAVAALVGAGPGLTPSGDDVLCGVLLGLRVHGSASAALVPALWAHVLPRLTATTSLSAALLTEAAEGYGVPPVARLAEAIVDGDEAGVAAAAAAVHAIGHSSGSDLLGGLVGSLEALTCPTSSIHPTTDRTPRAATPGSLP